MERKFEANLAFLIRETIANIAWLVVGVLST